MRLLVTGGAGFIGSHFVRYILREHPEDTVVNVDALTYAGNLENLADVAENPRYTFVKADICDLKAVSPRVAEADVVVHFAAETHVDRSIANAFPFVHSNVLGTVTLLEAAREKKTRFHHISTDEVFGALGPDDAPFTETTPFAPRSPYSASKAAAEHFVMAYHETYGLPVTISNCTNNYGSYHYPEKIIPLFIMNLLAGKKVPVYGDGLQVRDWMHVEDHCRGIDLVLRQGKIGERYGFGAGHETKNIDLASMLVRLTGRDESFIEHVTDRPGHDRRYAIDYTKVKRELGWEPRISLEEGLREVVAWYKANPGWVERALQK